MNLSILITLVRMKGCKASSPKCSLTTAPLSLLLFTSVPAIHSSPMPLLPRAISPQPSNGTASQIVARSPMRLAPQSKSLARIDKSHVGGSYKEAETAARRHLVRWPS